MNHLLIIVAAILLSLTSNANASWQRMEKPDVMRNVTVTIDYAKSENTINQDYPYQGPTYGFILIRNSPAEVTQISLSISAGQIICGPGRCDILFKFDDDKPKTYPCSTSSTHESNVLMVNDRGEFLNKLITSKTMVVEIPIFREGIRQFWFNISDYQKLNRP